MSDKLRVLQIGCGGRAQHHIAAMLASGAIDLVALCDMDEQRLHATGETFGIARRYRDMAEAIRAEQPELVDIVTPPTIRAAIVEPAIAAGAPALLIEKPLALTPSESRRLAELGRDRLIAQLPAGGATTSSSSISKTSAAPPGISSLPRSP